ncbi:MAG: hypothetical protein ABFD16_14730 [Thermoguttaceae bacterium]
MMLRLLGMAMVAVALLLAGDLQQAQAVGPTPAPALFQNYYVPPYAGGVGAELYPCPRPVPMNVGRTYITYQGLMPHEFLYKHARTYRTEHPDGNATRTRIRWR